MKHKNHAMILVFMNFKKEWYEYNGYLVLFENGHHKVYHKANN